MMKVLTSDKARDETQRLGVDIDQMVQNVLSHVPSEDVAGISSIYVTASPEDHTQHQQGALGAYYQKRPSRPAYIALYLKNLFRRFRNGEVARQMLPILEYGVAQTLFHECGHHVQQTRSHGVAKREKEKFADSYAKQLMKSYMLKNAELINACFDRLQTFAESRGVPREQIEALRASWEAEYRETIKPEKGIC